MRDPTEDEAVEVLMRARLLGYDKALAYELLQNYVRWLRGEPQEGWAQGALEYPPPHTHTHGKHGAYAFRWLWSGASGTFFHNHPEILPESLRPR